MSEDITERRRMVKQLQQRLTERENLLRVVHHRVKNNLQVVSRILRLQMQRAATAEIASEFEVGCNRIGSIALVHEQLYDNTELNHVESGKFIRELGENILQSADASGRLSFEVRGDFFALLLKDAVPCALPANELLTNSLKHAFPGSRPGRMMVEVRVDADGTLCFDPR